MLPSAAGLGSLGMDSLAAMPGQPMAAADGPEPVSAEPSQTSKMIDLAQVQGQVHAASVQKVGDLADKNPRETVSIIRQWLQESSHAA
jgi:flagellar M-ring protein FliF